MEADDATNKRDTRRSTAGGCLAFAVVIAVLFVSCVASGDDNGGGGSEDSAVSVSCRHFRNIAGDAPMLTDAELREKLLEVQQSASVAQSSELRAAAREMVIEVTRGTPAGFNEAVTRFGDECRRLGH